MFLLASRASFYPVVASKWPPTNLAPRSPSPMWSQPTLNRAGLCDQQNNEKWHGMLYKAWDVKTLQLLPCTFWSFIPEGDSGHVTRTDVQPDGGGLPVWGATWVSHARQPSWKCLQMTPSNLMRSPEPQPPAKSLLNSWPIERVGVIGV